MRQHEYDRFLNLLNAWAEIHGKSMSAGAIALWWQALERYDIEQVERAFAQLVRDTDRGQFLPKPADVIRILDGSRSDRAAIAWGKVLDAARQVGGYTDVVFDDPAIHAAIEDQGGWPKLCRTDAEELGYVQHAFAQSYRAYAERGEFNYPAVLTGDANAFNRLHRHDLQPPAFVGDPGKAQIVFDRGGNAKTSISRVHRIGDVLPAAVARLSTAKGAA